MKRLSIKMFLLSFVISNCAFAQYNIFSKSTEEIEIDLNEILLMYEKDSSLVIKGMGESFILVVESDSLGSIINIEMDDESEIDPILPQYLISDYLSYFNEYKVIKNVFYKKIINRFYVLVYFTSIGANVYICPVER